MSLDYPGVDDEEELDQKQKNNFALYPPVMPQAKSLAPVGAPDIAPQQEPSQSAFGDKPMGAMPQAPTRLQAETAQPQPQWKDYAPAEPHGWGKLGHALATINPITNQIFNEQPQEKAATAYKAATNERGERIKEAGTLETQERENKNTESLVKSRDDVTVTVGNKTYTVPRKDAEKLFGEGIKADAGQKKVETQGDTARDVADIHGDTSRDVAGTRAKTATETNTSHEKIAAQADRTKREVGMARIAAAKAKVAKAPPEVAKAHGTLEQSISRLNIMQENKQKALGGDQQAALSLLANHIGMTMGLVPGARINRQIYQEAEDSAPWLSRVEAHFDKDGLLSGVVLTPQQMEQMEDLAVNRLREDRRNLADTENYYGFHGNETTVPNGSTATPKQAPKVGEVVKGHKFKGGDPAKQENWEAVTQ